MALQDKWSERVWTINHAEPGPLHDVLMSSSGLTQFSLDPIVDGTNVIGYRVLFATGQMSCAWDPPCRFFRFGVDPPPCPTFSAQRPQLPLPPWDGSNQTVTQDYKTVATAIRDHCVIDPSIERLVGEIRVRGRREIVTLYQVDDLIAGNHAFLFIAVQSKDSLQDRGHDSMEESGIAHGNN